jgi:broad specificity phosphatase PhoE
MFERLPRLVLVPHADAGDRRTWTADQDLRPLSPLGVAQASALAAAIGVVDRIISSPARRCVETVEPLAAASGGVTIERSEELRELPFVDSVEPWDAWPLDPDWRAQLVAAAALGRAARLLESLAGEGSRGGRFALSAHGDLIPLLALFAAGSFGVPAPPRAARGGAYEIDASNASAPIVSIGALVPPPA